MSNVQMTGEEMFESLTGFEELAISKAFGGDAAALAQSQPTMFLRAMVFTDLRREGKSEAEAKQGAMEMTLKAASSYFLEDEDEVMPDAPDTESGKGDSLPA